jgi:aminoglycoside 2''-phosphotransferase
VPEQQALAAGASEKRLGDNGRMDPPASLLDRVRAAFPALTISSARLDPDGLVNDVVIVNEDWVCRFAKDERGKQALERESRVLDLVRNHVDVRVPEFLYQEPGFVAYRLLRGQPLYRHELAMLTDAQQQRLADQLASFLHQLHAISQTELQQQAIHASDAQRTPRDWQQLYADVEREVFPLLWRDQRAWVSHHFAPVLTDRLDLGYQHVLIHGDLAHYHILCEDSPLGITGILDFGTAGLGDPAGDFAVVMSMYGEGFLHRMTRSYPAIANALDRARFWAGTHELQWALLGIRSQDQSWFVAHIGRARPIGTPWRSA